MSKVLCEVETGQLRLGHYVAQLDRPWTETPFLFQGFVIEDEEQLRILRELCRHVHIEVSREEEAALRASRRPAPAPMTPVMSTLALLEKDPNALLASVPARDPVSLNDELPKAREVVGEARKAITQMFDGLQRGGSVDVGQLKKASDSMVESVFRNRDALTWLERLKRTDDYLYSHSLASSIWALAFGRHMGLDRETLGVIGAGAMLLDVGKTRLPPALLRKAERPSEPEWKTLRNHVQLGLELLTAQGPVDNRILTMVGTHHERLDGSGYPRRFKGADIPLLGRMAGIVDAYDAMISNRSYAQRRSTFEAVRELNGVAERHFPANLLELFVQAVGVFPTGSLVELNNGEVGIVIGQNRFRRLRPQIMLVLDTGKRPRSDYTVVDLLTSDPNVGQQQLSLWITRGLEPGAYGIDPAQYFL